MVFAADKRVFLGGDQYFDCSRGLCILHVWGHQHDRQAPDHIGQRKRGPVRISRYRYGDHPSQKGMVAEADAVSVAFYDLRGRFMLGAQRHGYANER